MKKLLSKKMFQFTFAFIIVAAVFSFAACQKETEREFQKENTVNTTNKNLNTAETQQRITANGRFFCYPLYYFKLGRPIFNCYFGAGVCKFIFWKCIPLYVEWPFRKWWEIYDLLKLRDEIIRFGQIPNVGEGVINPKEQLGVLPVNPRVVILQFGTAQRGVLDQKQFSLEEGFDLDENLVRQFELQGNHVPSGKFPVIYDEKNNTYNALVSVTEKEQKN
jgi:hypothetical protein